MDFPVSSWFAAFILTLAIEAPIVAVLFRRAEPNLLRLGVLVVFGNLATHLTVWYVIPQLLLIGTLRYTLAAELWATAAEALFYGAAIRGLSGRRALAVSVAANAASYVVGQLVAERWPQVFGCRWAGGPA